MDFGANGLADWLMMQWNLCGVFERETFRDYVLQLSQGNL
jgi:hypothetical protein